MKRVLALAVFTSLLIPLSALADPSGHMDMPEDGNNMRMQSSNLEDSMMKVQDRVKKMINQMKQIHATKDFGKRDELIAGHIMNMNEGIKEMRDMGGNMMKHLYGDKKGHVMTDYVRKEPGNMKTNTTNLAHMSERMESIEERLDILQIMLEQLIESRQAERSQRHGHL